jgi:hypothetical protein
VLRPFLKSSLVKQSAASRMPLSGFVSYRRIVELLGALSMTTMTKEEKRKTGAALFYRDADFALKH